MEFELKAGPQGHIYLPKILRKTFGERMKLMPDSIAGAIYNENATPEDVIASLETIILHLKMEQRKTIEKQGEKPREIST